MSALISSVLKNLIFAVGAICLTLVVTGHASLWQPEPKPILSHSDAVTMLTLQCRPHTESWLKKTSTDQAILCETRASDSFDNSHLY